MPLRHDAPGVLSGSEIGVPTDPPISSLPGLGMLPHRWRKRLWAVANLARWLFPAAFIWYLANRLSAIGWHQIWASLPSSLDFYLCLCLCLLFLIVPVSELFIYRYLWQCGKALRLSILLRKQFLNGLLIEYSGESYLFLWAKRHLSATRGRLLHSVKDSNLLSAGAGLLTVWLMLLLLMATGELRFSLPRSISGWSYVAIALLPLAPCLVLVFARRRVTTLSPTELATTFAVHFVRCLVCQGLQFALWALSGALPSTVACLNFVMLRLLISRLPLIPNKDLVFLGSGLAAATTFDLSVAPVAAVLVTLSIGDQLLNLGLAGVPWLVQHLGQLRTTGDEAPSQPETSIFDVASLEAGAETLLQPQLIAR